MYVVSSTDEALENHLLADLSAEEFARLQPKLRTLSLSLGEVIYESGGHMDYVYFPTTAIISLLYIMGNGPRLKSAWWATMGWSVLPSSWVATPLPTAR